MSHQPQRKEKDCLNCGTEVIGLYCHHCGQENVVTHQNFWSLVKHFVYDILHFDGKFFETMRVLLTRPGVVAKYYVAGKRRSYLDPIRMYLFCSAIFFLIFFSFQTFQVGKGKQNVSLDREDRVALADFYQQQLGKNPADTFLKRRIALLRDTTVHQLNIDSLGWQKDLLQSTGVGRARYTTVEAYDSVQKTLPPAQQDGLFDRYLTRKTIRANQKYFSRDEGIRDFINEFLHKLPYLLFVSLPFFAGILKLLYRRRSFYYSDHAVFTLYHYIFTFLLLLCLFGLNALEKKTGWSFFNTLLVILSFAWPVYLYLEMKNFYGQGKRKTFLKFIVLNFLGLILIAVLFVFFLALSFLQS